MESFIKMFVCIFYADLAVFHFFIPCLVFLARS